MPNAEKSGAGEAGGAPPSVLAIVPRVILLTFGLTGISFAVSLFLGILGMAAAGIFRGQVPDMRLAYRSFALPIAETVGAAAFVCAWVVEIRHYRKRKMLAPMNLERSH